MFYYSEGCDSQGERKRPTQSPDFHVQSLRRLKPSPKPNQFQPEVGYG